MFDPLVAMALSVTLTVNGTPGAWSPQKIPSPVYPVSRPRYDATLPVSLDVASSRAQVFLDGKSLLILSEGLPDVVTTLSGMIGRPEYASCPKAFMAVEEHDNVSIQVVLRPHGTDETEVEVVGDFTTWHRGWFARMMSKRSGSGRWFGKYEDCVTTGQLERRILEAIRDGVRPDEIQRRDGVFGAASPTD